MEAYYVQSPVLFIVFNRPEAARRVFEGIRAARPSRLYIAADGQRPGHEADAENCRNVRGIVDLVDWDCEVKTLFSEENKGCKLGPVSAITWFFEQEPEGIILEDDCVPGRSFFRFCDEMLERYRHDTRIYSVGGTNKQMGRKWGEASYYYARLGNICGWASWRRVWQQYDHTMGKYPLQDVARVLTQVLQDRFIVHDWLEYLQVLLADKLDAWDYQFHLLTFFQGGLAILPNVNLITNIGFGEGATHTFDDSDPRGNIPIVEMSFPISHPSVMLPETGADYASLSIDHDLYNRWRRYNKRKRRFVRWCRRVLGGKKDG